MDGILIIDKPAGPTSHDVVQEVKKILGAKKVGHLGTLDPAASGVLPLVINRATKFANQLSGGEKVYEFDLILGQATDTDDDQGRIIHEAKVLPDAEKKIMGVIEKFIGEILQVPPAYSAIKVGGKPMYMMARKGKPIVGKPRVVQIYALSICSNPPSPPFSKGGVGGFDVIGRCILRIRMHLRCSTGTYVRALCRDIGETLGCHGHAANIRRLQSGPYSIADTISLEEFKSLLPETRLEIIHPVKI